MKQNCTVSASWPTLRSALFHEKCDHLYSLMFIETTGVSNPSYHFPTRFCLKRANICVFCDFGLLADLPNYQQNNSLRGSCSLGSSPAAPNPTPVDLDHLPKRPPADLENAATEQVAFWFQNRDKLGQIRNWPAGGNYIQLADTDLLPSVRAILRRYTRIIL
jgi:hypothetical protein